MELVCWKTQGDKTSVKVKSTYHVKIWEKYRTSRGKNAGQVIEVSASSKFKLAIKLSLFLIKHYKWL